MARMANARRDVSELKYFERVATFPVCRQIDLNCNNSDETVAEIVVATDDGMTAVYTDSEKESLGLVDITDPKDPLPLGTIVLSGEPTSVALKGSFALAAVNTSPDFIDPSGELQVVDITTKTIVRTIDLEGQPDSIAISPDKKWAVIAIENERDEDLGDGEIPQLPAGFVAVINIEDADPGNWPDPTFVDVTGLDGVYEPTDPEPEYVSINEENIAVVTLQENNAVVLIDVESKQVITSFSMGSVDLDNIDTVDDGIVNQTNSLSNVLREPDGVTWITNDFFAVANEGDMLGGSRGFSIFDSEGSVVYESGSSAEHLLTSFGHYPEGRSGKKGVEFENVAYAKDLQLLFVVSERGSVNLVYDVSDPSEPKYHQVLPAGVGPEGGYYIENRGLFISACEKDDRDAKFRASLVIYEYGSQFPTYPTIMSVEDESIGNGVPIHWSALSGLSPPSTSSPKQMNTLYAVEDSAFKRSRVFTIQTASFPAKLIKDMYIKDDLGVFAAVEPCGEFSAADRDAMINDDNTVNIDAEGIVATESGFWVASEGRGTFGDASRPIESLNFLFRLDKKGVIEEVVTLPDSVNNIQLRFGFEGVSHEGDYVVVAFQRAWGDESNVRLGLYNTDTEEWKFVFYPLDTPTSQKGGWVGLSDISSVGEGDFLVLERDNQGGPDAAIKKIYSISLGDLDGVSDGDVITKTLVRDILNETAPGGVPLEKVEGLAILDGNVWIVNDNDGLDDSSGETQLINLGDII